MYTQKTTTVQYTVRLFIAYTNAEKSRTQKKRIAAIVHFRWNYVLFIVQIQKKIMKLFVESKNTNFVLRAPSVTSMWRIAMEFSLDSKRWTFTATYFLVCVRLHVSRQYIHIYIDRISDIIVINKWTAINCDSVSLELCVYT